MTRLLQLSARCHGDGAPYKAAAGVGLARRARAAPSPVIGRSAGGPAMAAAGSSSVLARASSRPAVARGARRGWREETGGGGGGGPGGGGHVPAAAAAAAWRGMSPRGPPRTPHRAPRARGFRPSAERSGARRADKTPLKGSARGRGWERGLRRWATWRCHETRRARTSRDSRRVCAPAMPERERERKVPRFSAEG